MSVQIRNLGSESSIAYKSRKAESSLLAMILCLLVIVSVGCTKPESASLSGPTGGTTGGNTGGGGGGSGGGDTDPPVTVDDFALSELNVTGFGIADGSTSFSVSVLLRNSDNSLVSGFTPTLEVASGSGVTLGSCTQSSTTGISTCSLTASEAGVKNLALTNAKVGLSASIDFVPLGRVVQKNSGFVAASSLSVSFTSPVTAGNSLIACTTSASLPTGLSDDQGNTWTAVAETSAGTFHSVCWQAKEASAGSATVTVTGAGAHVLMTIVEISGLLVLDKTGVADGTGASVSMTAVGITDAQARFVLSYAAEFQNYAIWGTSDGSTIEHQTQGNGTGYIAALASKNVYNTSQHTASMTKDYPADTWHGIILTFRQERPVPALVQHETAQALASTSVTVNLPAPTNGGNAIIACIINGDGTPSITDDGGNWYRAAGGTGNSVCKVAFNASHETTAVTYTTSGGATDLALAVFEVSGNLSEIEFSHLEYGNGGSSVTTSAPAPLSTSKAYVFGFASDYYDAPVFTNWSVSSDFSVIAELNPGSGGHSAVFAEMNEKENLSGTPTIDFTSGDVKLYWFGAIMALK